MGKIPVNKRDACDGCANFQNLQLFCFSVMAHICALVPHTHFFLPYWITQSSYLPNSSSCPYLDLLQEIYTITLHHSLHFQFHPLTIIRQMHFSWILYLIYMRPSYICILSNPYIHILGIKFQHYFEDFNQAILRLLISKEQRCCLITPSEPLSSEVWNWNLLSDI